MSNAAGPANFLQSLVRERIDAWRSGGEPDAAEFLAEHPELEQNKSLVLDLALEEYCLRTAAGDTLVKSTFCERFPAYRQSIFKLLEVQEYLDKCPQFAIASQPSQWPQAGERFLGYEVIEQLGSGALARVYLAREPALGQRLVVIKVSRFGTAEAETLGKLSHSNVVPVHSVQHDSVSGWTAICMPLLGTATAVDLLDAAFANGRPREGSVISRVGGKRRAIAGGSPSAAELRESRESREWRGTYSDAIARLGLQLAEGLAAAHAAGVLHHDIKPSNVLLAWSGKPMLLDFNLSRDEDSATERIGGTLPYMAPELIASLQAGRGRCNDARHDPRCDVYSLGCVLYELLAGKLPARPAGAERLPLDAYQPWLDVKRQGPPRLSEVDSSIDGGLAAIVQRCLAFDPAGRFASADALAEELRWYLSPAPAARRYVQRHRRGFLAAGISLGLGAIAAGTFLGMRKPYPERLLARGLALYEQGEFEQALLIFEECNRLNRDWPEARFASGQTLRRLGRFDDARDDFGALEAAHLGWAQALIGYCHMRAKNDVESLNTNRYAYRLGVREPRFVFNYADSLRRKNFFVDAVAKYTEVLAAQPDNVQARRSRARCYYCIAKSQPKHLAVPDAQAFEDARVDIRCNGDSYEPYYLAAIILGFAVSVDQSLEWYREEGSYYLLRALRAGMPRTLYDADAAKLDVLKTDEMEALIEAAKPLAKGIFHDFHQQQEFPQTAEWSQFLAEVGGLGPSSGGSSTLLARSSGDE